MKDTAYDEMRLHEDGHWWYAGLRHLVVRTIRQFSGDHDLKILDAGCGTGGLLKELTSFGQTDGLDVSDRAIAHCRERGLSNVRKEDLNTGVFPREFYDVIISLDVLYHKAIQDQSNVLARFYDSLKPGGFLILNLPAFEMLRRQHDEWVDGARRYQTRGLRNLLLKAGFQVSLLTYRLPWLFPIAFFSRKPSLTPPLSPVNWLLRGLVKMENNYILRGGWLPAGLSVFAVAQKPAG